VALSLDQHDLNRGFVLGRVGIHLQGIPTRIVVLVVSRLKPSMHSSSIVRLIARIRVYQKIKRLSVLFVRKNLNDHMARRGLIVQGLVPILLVQMG